MKSYIEHDIVWVSAQEFADEYHKSRGTIGNWIETGYILQMGFRLKRDISGFWLIGKPYNWRDLIIGS